MSLCTKSFFIMVILYLSINSTAAPPTSSPSTSGPTTAQTPSPSTFGPLTAPTTSTTFSPTPAPSSAEPTTSTTFNPSTEPTSSSSSAEPTPIPSSSEPTPSPSTEPTPSPSTEPTPSPSSAEPTPSPSTEPTPCPSECAPITSTTEPIPSLSTKPTPSPSTEPTPCPSECAPEIVVVPNPPCTCTPGLECDVENPERLCGYFDKWMEHRKGHKFYRNVFCDPTLHTDSTKGKCCYWDGTVPYRTGDVLEGMHQFDERLCCSKQSHVVDVIYPIIKYPAKNGRICCEVDDGWTEGEEHKVCCIRRGGYANQWDNDQFAKHPECCSGRIMPKDSDTQPSYEVLVCK